MTRYYAQHREDEWIDKHLGHILPVQGFYVDIGCSHPFTKSNTAFLRDRKWSGLAVDGDRRVSKYWEGIPHYCLAVVSEKPEVNFVEDPQQPFLSRISEEPGQTRFAVPINILLQVHGVHKIDLLSVDTEGAEYDILAELNFRKHDPTIVIAEYNTHNIGADNRIRPLMEIARGYHMRLDNGVNMIFSK